MHTAAENGCPAREAALARTLFRLSFPKKCAGAHTALDGRRISASDARQANRRARDYLRCS